MYLIAIGLLTTVFGGNVADIGWQPLPGGGVEYIIQLRPETLDLLKSGQDCQGEFPPQLPDVRGYRITVGQGPVRRLLPETPMRTGAAPVPPALPAPLPPDHLMPDPRSQPLRETRAVFNGPPLATTPQPAQPIAPKEIAPVAAKTPAPAEPVENVEPARSWFALTATLIALFASIGLNVFLGWTTWDYRRRYQEVVTAR